MNSRWIIRVASHHTHGGGHVSRMIALANALRTKETEPIIVLDPNSPQACELFEHNGYECRVAGGGLPGEWAGAILDGYSFQPEEIATLSKMARPIIYLDDFLEFPDWADLVINALVDPADNKLDQKPSLTGSEYAIIDPQFSRIADRDRTQSVERIVVTFGKLDDDNVAGRVLRLLSGLTLEAEIILTASSASPHLEQLKSDMSDFAQRGRLLLDQPDMIPLLSECDLVIGAGGVSLLERMSAGVPSVTLSIADNQKAFVRTAIRHGASVDGGGASSSDDDLLEHAITNVLENGAIRKQMSDAGRKLIDGRGADRVADSLILFAENFHRAKSVGIH